MKQHTYNTREQIAGKRNFTLLELLDRLLDKGVMVKGEILLTVADIDLVYLNLGLLLSSVKSVEEAACAEVWMPVKQREEYLDELQLETRSDPFVPASSLPASLGKEHGRCESSNGELSARILPTILQDGLDQYLTPKTNIDPKNVEKGLARLVLTLVDLLRKLMEKQAIRRMEAGQLNCAEIEKMGETFLLLDERMEQLKEVFGLQGEELNLDLGPLGDLL